MSEIEKMYENAGVEPIAEYCKHQCNNEFDDDMCIGCKYIEKVEYPPFTAEKQILLFQWLLDKTDLYLHRHKTDFTYSIASGDIAVNKYKDFKESIAEFINTLWQDLTETDRNEIRDILKG